MLLEAVKRSLRPKQKLVVALSGGLDSATLLYALYLLKDKLKLDLIVAHVDHGFRKESARDLEFSKRLASKYGLRFVSKKLPKLPKGANLESWGREKRYEFLVSVLKRRKFDAIVTAHQGDDVAETLIMKLVSNKEMTSPKRFDDKRRVIRPLLTIPRSEILKFAKSNKLKWREDLSNLDERRLRNLVRRRAIPSLEGIFGAGIKAHLVDRAFAVDEDLDALAFQAKEIALSLRGKRRKSTLSIKSIKEALSYLPIALRWRVIESLLLPLTRFPIGRLHAKRALSVVEGEHLRCELPSKIMLERKRDELVASGKSL